MATNQRRPIFLFDVMDTLVHEPFHREMPAFFGMSLEQLIASKHPTAWIEFELGQLSESEFLTGFFRDGRAFDHGAFQRSVHEAYRWLPGMEALLGTLAGRGHAIHALSNYPCWYHAIEQRLALSRFLEWSFVSCDTGVRKPDREAFAGPLARLAVAPEECLFVDDREANCAAARALGIPALRFTSSAELAREFARRGLLAAG